MRFSTLAVLVSLFVFAVTSSASANTARVSALLGQTGICQNWQPVDSKQGQVVLQASNIAASDGLRGINVSVAAKKLAPRQKYEVWLADLTISEGSITGCSALPIGTFKTNGAGSGTFNGAGQSYPGARSFQVLVSISDPFISMWAYTTAPINYQVP